ncbi:unnamed protein product, partial [Prorocentrum cordatum]
MVGDPTVDRAREMFIGAADGDEAEPTEPRTPLLPRGGSAVSARCTERCPDLAPAGRASALLPPRWARPPPSRGAAARAWASAAALRGGPGVSATGGSPSEAPGAGGAGPRAPSSSDPVQRRAGGARGERSPWRAARCGKTAARGEAPARICGRPPRASLPSLPSR